MKAYIAIALGERETKSLKSNAGHHALTFGQELSAEEQKAHFLQSEIAFGNVPAGWLAEAKALRWLQLESVGFGEYQRIEVSNALKITNLRGMFSVPVVESVIGGILAIFRGIDELSRCRMEKEWRKDAIRARLRTLHGARAIIIGGGSIGNLLKERLKCLGTEVVMMDKYNMEAQLRSTEALDEQLPEADVVVSCLPETAETKLFFDRTRLQKLHSGAVFVNVGRGSVVDETVLIDLLQEKKIGGCVLDVTNVEPLPAESPLWECGNCILTQHTGGGSTDELLHKVEVFLKNLARYEHGDQLENVVDLKRGF
jgi:phosphoglycerate dehydrogenase-like enzyme